MRSSFSYQQIVRLLTFGVWRFTAANPASLTIDNEIDAITTPEKTPVIRLPVSGGHIGRGKKCKLMRRIIWLWSDKIRERSSGSQRSEDQAVGNRSKMDQEEEEEEFQ